MPPILIIDDEHEWRATFEDVFASTGLDADSVADIPGAKELLKEKAYKVIILDIFLSPTQVPLSTRVSHIRCASIPRCDRCRGNRQSLGAR